MKLQSEQKKTFKLPYYFYCPTVSDYLIKITCKACGSYFASAKNIVDSQAKKIDEVLSILEYLKL